MLVLIMSTEQFNPWFLSVYWIMFLFLKTGRSPSATNSAAYVSDINDAPSSSWFTCIRRVLSPSSCSQFSMGRLSSWTHLVNRGRIRENHSYPSWFPSSTCASAGEWVLVAFVIRTNIWSSYMFFHSNYS
jgi:hypothetical protein